MLICAAAESRRRARHARVERSAQLPPRPAPTRPPSYAPALPPAALTCVAVPLHQAHLGAEDGGDPLLPLPLKRGLADAAVGRC